MKKETKELLNDVAVQMKVFGRPSEENVKAMMHAIESLSRDLKEAEEESGEYWSRLKVTEKELEYMTAERDSCIKRIYEAKGIADYIKNNLRSS